MFHSGSSAEDTYCRAVKKFPSHEKYFEEAELKIGEEKCEWVLNLSMTLSLI